MAPPEGEHRRDRPKGGPQVAGRRPLFAKPCHVDLISVWTTGRCKNLSVSFADSSPIRGAIC